MIYIIYLFIFLFGLMIGSFLNCLIWRLHQSESLWGRSYCPKCKKQIAWYDNIPLLSFILLKGKCRSCQQTISWQYPAVELITGLLFLLIAIRNLKFEIWGNADFINQISNFQFQISLIRDWFIISVMIVIFIYDLRWYMILDIITLPACLVVFILNLFLGFDLWNMLFSGIIGGSFFLLQYLVSRGKWIGGGDIRLGLLMGLIFGWPQVLVALVLSYFMGSIVSIGLVLASKKKWGSQIPLGVFLSVGTVLTMLRGQEILNWYLGLF